jgi:hypothetical protein
VPVNVSVLWDPFNADVVKDLASEDFSVLEGAEPWGGLWKTQNRPTLFITLGKCVRCDGPFLMFVEMHGTDEVRNTAYLGDLILHREIEKESGERLLDIAQKRGLLMY